MQQFDCSSRLICRGDATCTMYVGQGADATLSVLCMYHSTIYLGRRNRKSENAHKSSMRPKVVLYCIEKDRQ